jgi:hypothetical protein
LGKLFPICGRFQVAGATLFPNPVEKKPSYSSTICGRDPAELTAFGGFSRVGTANAICNGHFHLLTADAEI